MLAPHMDTVGGIELPGKLFAPRLQGNRLFGRGACDTKGSVAAMLSALIAVSKSAQRPSETEITLAALVDEECAQAGSRALAATRPRVDLAIVGEPTRLKVVTAHKGVLWLELRTRGKSAHGARPELGRNAVHEMARVVDLLETTYAAQLQKRRHPLLGHATVNVGAMHGGSQPNIVPAECVSLVDRRLLPGETDSGVIREMQNLLRKNKLSASMRRTHPAECRALETDPRNELVRRFLRSAGQRGASGVDFFSDAAVLAEAGIPSVLFGPGDIAQAHTPDEWIDPRQLDSGAEILAQFLQSLP
jgi:acetylornithine deacetylase/succinyl-diaminopimelate desuccinylase-like protein